MNDDKNLFEDTNIDYSEGIGELLKDKNKYEFSWKKTGTVVAGLVIVLAISVAGVSKLAKALIIPAPDQYQSFEFSETEDTLKADSITEFENDSFDEDDASEIESETVSTEATIPKQQETRAENSEPKAIIKIATPQKSSVQTQLANALYRVVIGRFDNRQAASEILGKLKNDRHSAYIWQTTEEGKPVYRVQVGAFSKETSAKTMTSTLNRNGYSPYILYR